MTQNVLTEHLPVSMISQYSLAGIHSQNSITLAKTADYLKGGNQGTHKLVPITDVAVKHLLGQFIQSIPGTHLAPIQSCATTCTLGVPLWII